jgi:hypothetical protein
VKNATLAGPLAGIEPVALWFLLENLAGVAFSPIVPGYMSYFGYTYICSLWFIPQTQHSSSTKQSSKHVFKVFLNILYSMYMYKVLWRLITVPMYNVGWRRIIEWDWLWWCWWLQKTIGSNQRGIIDNPLSNDVVVTNFNWFCWLLY